MPETRIEKALFAFGIIAIAALGFLVARLWHHTHGVVAAPSTSRSQPVLTTSATRPTTSSRVRTKTRSTRRATTSATTHPQKTTAAPTPPPPTNSLVLTARSDTWLEIRAASSTGALLYSGTLTAGTTKRLHARSFWARFGAAGNVSVRLGGKAIHLPSGTYDAVLDRRGFRRTGA